jgi:hypothetical protein
MTMARRTRLLIHEVGWPLGASVGFFAVRAFLEWNELSLTLLALAAIVVTFSTDFHRGELKIFFFGLLYGIVVEIGLGSIHRQQIWLDASFFGIPTWLPIMWGLGFIYIGRFAAFVRRLHQ